MKARKSIGFIMALGLITLSGFQVRAAHRPSDEKIWKEYVESRTDFEKNVHDLVATRWPAQKDIAKEHLTLELERMELKTAQFKYLDEKYPNRIKRDKSIDDFVALDWSNDDDKALRAHDADYVKQANKVAELEARYNSHAAKSKFEGNLEDVKDSMEYRSYKDKFNSMIARLESSLKQTKKSIQKKF